MIRTFLFDMGNVLVHFSHERMCDQIGALCGRPGHELQRDLIDSGHHLNFERGLIPPEMLHGWFESNYAVKVDRSALANAASDIFTLNEPMVPILDELKSRGYRLVLLSNTSIFHLEFIRERFDFLNRFDDLVLSYEVQAVKPEPEIFEAALRRINCSAPECFYTDDIAKYVEEGRRHGLDAEVFTTADELKVQLGMRGIRVQGGAKA